MVDSKLSFPTNDQLVTECNLFSENALSISLSLSENHIPYSESYHQNHQMSLDLLVKVTVVKVWQLGCGEGVMLEQ